MKSPDELESPDELKSPDELNSHEVGIQCGSVAEALTEPKNLTLQISVSTVGDEGYGSRRPSDDVSVLSSSGPSKSSMKSASSTSKIPPSVLEDGEDSKPITFDCSCDSDDKDPNFFFTKSRI